MKTDTKTDTKTDAKANTKLDEFTAQYIETALWSSVDMDGESEFLDANYGPDDLAPETLESIIDDCRRFQEQTESMISIDLSQAGHDFWLTRNGHGAGFWDGDWPEHGDELTKACEAFREVHLYAQDGKIYQE